MSIFSYLLLNVYNRPFAVNLKEAFVEAERGDNVKLVCPTNAVSGYRSCDFTAPDNKHYNMWL